MDTSCVNDEAQASGMLELVISRISHDLFNPLGAIANGVELLEQTTASAEMDLVKASIAMANAKLKLMRGGFGAENRREGVSQAEIQKLFRDLSTLSRHKYIYKDANSVNASTFKKICLATMVGESVLAYGGTITIALRQNERYMMLAEGRNIRFQPETLTNEDPVDAGTIHFPAFIKATKENGFQTYLSETRFELEF